MTAGYSGKPLADKLGLKNGQRVAFLDMPAAVRADIDARDIAVVEVTQPPFDLVHVFVTEASALSTTLRRLRHEIAQDGMVWVSWPKRAAKRETDITEDRVRDLALPIGFVDVKVCAVDEVWSGLKLVIRKSLR